MGFEEFERFWNAGHSCGGWFDNVFEFLKGGEFILEDSFAVSIDFFLELFILDALNEDKNTRSSYYFFSFFLSFLGASADI